MPEVIPSSLIIATRNRGEMLTESVSSVLGGTAVPTEVIIVDQSDRPDRSVEAMVPPQGSVIRYVLTAERGLSRANNLGIDLAKHEVLAFTHDDIRAHRDWYATLMKHLQHGGPSTVVTGRVEAGEPEVDGGFAPTLTHETASATYRGRVGKDVLKPLNMALYRSAAKAVGGFDPNLGPGTRFPGAEDADLGFRLLETGHTIEYVPAAVIYHRAWRAPEDYLPLRWAYGVAQGAFFAKHVSRSDRYMLSRMGRDWLRRLRRFPLRLVREGRRALGDPLFMAGNVVGALRWRFAVAGQVGRS
jgi:O-antigen biosynthesis protein